MTEIQRLDAASAAAGLRAAGAGARGFLGVDPVTQNDALLAIELTRLDAQVYRAGDTLVGCMPNREQPRQAFVACTSGEPGPVRALLTFLATYQRYSSYVALVPAGSAAVAAFTGCDLEETGVLREHRYQSGRYLDVLVYVAGTEHACVS